MRDRGWAIIIAAILAVAGGCALSTRPSVDDPGEAVGGAPSDAARLVVAWLDMMTTRTGDFGWTLLFPYVRTDLIRSEDVYRSAVQDADWSRFDYDLGDTRTRDGEYWVHLRFPGGSATVPEFLLRWGLIQFVSVDGVEGADAFVTVRIDPVGVPFGIQATG